MRLALAFAACAVAFRAPAPPLRRPVALRAADLDEIRKMRASAIQQELRAAGVRYDDCFEKDELAKRLLAFKNGEDVPKSAPAPARSSGSGTPRTSATPRTLERPSRRRATCESRSASPRGWYAPELTDCMAAPAA